MPHLYRLLISFAMLVLFGDQAFADSWHAYVRDGQRVPRTKAEIAALMRTGDSKILRVRPEVIMSQVATRLGRGNWESTGAFAEWIESEKVTEEVCTGDLIKRKHLARTNAHGTSFDYNWQRERCDPGEKFLVFNGQQFLSNTCLNLIPEERHVVASPSDKCPGGFTLLHHFWDGGRLRRDLAEQAAHLTQQEQNFRSAAVSRTIGGQLRKCADNGQCRRVAGATASVRLLNPDGSLFREVGRILADISGVGTMRLPTAEAESKTISIIFDNTTFVSPPVGRNGLRELQSFPHERIGECGTNTHSILGSVRVAQSP